MQMTIQVDQVQMGMKQAGKTRPMEHLELLEFRLVSYKFHVPKINFYIIM